MNSIKASRNRVLAPQVRFSALDHVFVFFKISQKASRNDFKINPLKFVHDFLQFLTIFLNEITTILPPLTSERGEWERSCFWIYLIYKARTRFCGSNVLSSPSTECYKTTRKNSQWPAHGLGKRSIPKSSIRKLQLSFQVIVRMCLCVSATFILQGKYIKPYLDYQDVVAEQLPGLKHGSLLWGFVVLLPQGRKFFY